MSLRLAFIVSMYFPFGGMQRTLLRIASECQSRGHQVDIYTGSWQAGPPEGIGVIELDTRARSNHRSNRRLAEQALAAVRASGHDVTVGFTKIPGLDIYYAADPCYAARADEDHGWLYRWLPRYRELKRLEQAVFDPAVDTEILLIAHQEKQKFIRYYGTQEQRFHCLPPGINRQRLLDQVGHGDRRAIRSEFGIGQDERMLLGVGSRFRTKGVDRSIRALASLPAELRASTHFIHVGEGQSEPYQRQAVRLGIGEQVHFTGARDDMARFYAAADLLVHAPRSENTGTVLIEAMLLGVPVLTADVCGFAFHVRDAGAGRVCPQPFAQVQLNEALLEMINQLDNADWRSNGPKYCQRTDIESLIDRAADIIIAMGREKTA